MRNAVVAYIIGDMRVIVDVVCMERDTVTEDAFSRRPRSGEAKELCRGAEERAQGYRRKNQGDAELKISIEMELDYAPRKRY